MKTNILNKILIIILFTSLIILLIYIGYVLIYKTFIYPTKYSKYVIEAASINNIDPYLIFAIIKQESNFNKNACSKKEAKGLMQILDSTAYEIAQNIAVIDTKNIDLYDAKTNIYIGTKYFKTLVDRYNGNIRLAICAYNAGLGNVDKWKQSYDIYSNSEVNISNIPFKETKTYLVNIIKYYNKYVKLYNQRILR